MAASGRVARGRRGVKIGAVALAATLVLGACAVLPIAGRRPGSVPGVRLLPLHAVRRPGGNGRIVDAAGREVLLRGVNVNALVDYWRYGLLPTTFPLTEADADRIGSIGWDAVRLLVSWSRVEPAPGVYDEAYLHRVADAVALLARHGVYSIIDLHQDAWSATLAAPPGEVCPAGSSRAFGWDGAPGWATLDGGAARCAPSGIRELSPAVLAAFDAFWRDAPGPGGVGIRTRYVAMLRHLATRFARDPAVAGFDVMNEPNAYTSVQLESLASFEADAVAAIRAGERAARGFPHLVLLEPSITWSDFGLGAPASLPTGDDVVYAPHLYAGGLSAGPVSRAQFERARSDAAGYGGVPVVVGEWGADPARAADPHDPYFVEHQALQDVFGFSATLWTWRESCGDPHKAAAARAGQVPYVWGEFDVDCRTDTVLGPRRALLSELRRAYVRAAPGRLLATTASTDGGLDARGVGARPGQRLEAFAPTRPAGRGTTGLRAVRTVPVRGGVRVVAVATGGAWSLRLRAGAPTRP